MTAFDERTVPLTAPMTPQAPLHQPSLGGEGEPCDSCGAPLASDQRYCLQCGARRGGARIPFREVLGEPAPAVAAVTAEPVAVARDRRPLWAALGTTALALFMLGYLLGTAGEDQTLVQVPAAKAPVVNITNTGGGGGAPAAVPAEFVTDWPGEDAWTVRLETLAKEETDPAAVAAAKTAAQAKGAGDVGALDSDEYGSLDGGDYVIYSGVHPSRKAATKALRGLKQDFPEAKVIKVAVDASDRGGAKAASDAELKKKENLSGEEFQKQSKKLPDKLKSQGAAPKKDNKEAGGGSDAEEIG